MGSGGTRLIGTNATIQLCTLLVLNNRRKVGASHRLKLADISRNTVHPNVGYQFSFVYFQCIIDVRAKISPTGTTGAD